MSILYKNIKKNRLRQYLRLNGYAEKLIYEENPLNNDFAIAEEVSVVE